MLKHFKDLKYIILVRNFKNFVLIQKLEQTKNQKKLKHILTIFERVYNNILSLIKFSLNVFKLWENLKKNCETFADVLCYTSINQCLQCIFEN